MDSFKHYSWILNTYSTVWC